MNSVIEQLRSHRSIRKFTEQAIAPALFDELILAGQGAATSSFLQGTTIIRVRNEQTRASIAELAGNQRYVESAAEFLVFCADLRRSGKCCAMHGKSQVEGFTEHFIIATVDVALMAQSLVVAAESAGLGICYIGGIRNNPAQVSDLLRLPRGVYPVFGMCLGYPDQDPEVKPRLPMSLILMDEVYDDSDNSELFAKYDALTRDYYRTRTGGTKDICWSEQMAGLLGKESRPHMRGFLRDQGFDMQ